MFRAGKNNVNTFIVSINFIYFLLYQEQFPIVDTNCNPNEVGDENLNSETEELMENNMTAKIELIDEDKPPVLGFSEVSLMSELKDDVVSSSLDAESIMPMDNVR